MHGWEDSERTRQPETRQTTTGPWEFAVLGEASLALCPGWDTLRRSPRSELVNHSAAPGTCVMVRLRRLLKTASAGEVRCDSALMP